MCHDIAYMTKRRVKYAERLGADIPELQELEEEALAADPTYFPRYHGNGFAHDPIPVITHDNPGHLRFYNWGLIPHWVKDLPTARKLSNSCINAKGETMFEKPSFRGPAKHGRCLVLVDGFFEHFHYKGKTYPFFISLRSKEPFCLAGLWERWSLQEEGVEKHTCSIVTTKANSLLGKIHNNPKIEEPRMPVMLTKEVQWDWLLSADDPVNLKKVKELIRPFDENEMVAYPVPKLRGKNAVGNQKQAMEFWEYPELREVFESDEMLRI